MKILIVSEYWVPHERGGGEVSAVLFAQGLVQLGHHVTVLTSRFLGDSTCENTRGVRIVRRLRTGENPGQLMSNLHRLLYFERSVRRETRLLLSQESFDVIHAMGMTSLVPLAHVNTSIPKTAHINSTVWCCPKGTRMRSLPDATIICDVPRCHMRAFVPCLFRTDEMGKQSMSAVIRYNPCAYALLFHRFLKSTHRNVLHQFHFVAISSYLKTLLIGHGVEENRVTVVHNPVPVTHYLESDLHRHTPPRVYYIGNYVESKGLRVLVDALSRISVPYECHVYGSGPLDVRELARSFGITVQVHGRVKPKDLPRIHQQNDICVLPSLVVEGLGRVLIEAMAAGNAVIGSDSGGIPDVFTDGKHGMLVPRGDVKALAVALTQLITDSTMRETMGRRGRIYAKRTYQQKHLCNQLVLVFEAAIRSSRQQSL